MKKILRFTFSLLLIFSLSSLKAQKKEWNGISVGVDLSRFVVLFIDTTRYGWEFSGDFEMLKDLFLVAEIGSQSTNFQTNLYKYTSTGGYTRFGADYNFMKHVDPDSKDKMFIGVRYGFTTFTHDADNIRIIDSNWGDFTGGNIEPTLLAANWLEIGTGMRARLFNNFYLGWSARIRIKIGVSHDDVMEPYSIPGYGQPWSNTSAGFNYSIYYKIPLYKKTVKLP